MMFRLPVCPHCGTVYRYKDTKKAIKEKKNICYHCQKEFKVKYFPYILVDIVLLLALCIAVNILLLNRMTALNLFALFGVTLAFMLAGYLLVPFFIRFVKIENTKNKKKK